MSDPTPAPLPTIASVIAILVDAIFIARHNDLHFKPWSALVSAELEAGRRDLIQLMGGEDVAAYALYAARLGRAYGAPTVFTVDELRIQMDACKGSALSTGLEGMITPYLDRALAVLPGGPASLLPSPPAMLPTTFAALSVMWAAQDAACQAAEDARRVSPETDLRARLHAASKRSYAVGHNHQIEFTADMARYFAEKRGTDLAGGVRAATRLTSIDFEYDKADDGVSSASLLRAAAAVRHIEAWVAGEIDQLAPSGEWPAVKDAAALSPPQRAAAGVDPGQLYSGVFSGGVGSPPFRPGPSVPKQCPSCEWSNTGLLNYSVVPNGPALWLCHGCAARRIAELIDGAARRIAELIDGRKTPTPDGGVLPMDLDDGTRITCDSLAGGADSTNGEPNRLTLRIARPGATSSIERVVEYRRLGRAPVEGWRVTGALVAAGSETVGRPVVDIRPGDGLTSFVDVVSPTNARAFASELHRAADDADHLAQHARAAALEQRE